MRRVVSQFSSSVVEARVSWSAAITPSTLLASTRLFNSGTSSSSSSAGFPPPPQEPSQESGSAFGDGGAYESVRTDRFSSTAAGEALPDPLMYNVPVVAARTVGRDAEVMSLWQNLLSGRRVQVVSGVDGIGKSTIAAEFCDCIRRSQRFTCVQWFNGKSDLKEQLAQFFWAMKGRKENDVLLVLDDVDDVDAVLTLLPEHKKLFTLITTPKAVQSSNKFGVLAPLPVSSTTADDLLNDCEAMSANYEEVHAVLDQVGYVPLLVLLVRGLLDSGAATPSAIKSKLDEENIMTDRVLSVSNALAVLVDTATEHLSATFPQARLTLAALGALHTSDLSDALIDAVMGGDASTNDFAQAAVKLNLLTYKWEESAYAMHSTIATHLVRSGPQEALDAAAVALLSLWPRRWRSLGSHLAYTLAWHARALHHNFVGASRTLSPALLMSMDRSATFLAHGEGRDLQAAANLWYGVFTEYKRRAAEAQSGAAKPASEEGSDALATVNPAYEAVRVGRECGRLLLRLRGERARDVLRDTYDMACAVHGDASTEAALILACYAPLIEASAKNKQKLRDAVDVLSARLMSSDTVIGREEQQMMHESMFVLTMSEGQMCEELGEKTPDRVWDTLEELDRIIKREQGGSRRGGRGSEENAFSSGAASQPGSRRV